MCPTVVTDAGVRKWVKISVLKAVPNMDCVGASPEQPSPCGVWEGALVDLAVMLQLCLWARPERRLQLLALRVTQITVHYRNSLFPNCPESHWGNRGVGGIGRKQQQRWCFLKMWQSSSISLWGGRSRVLYLPLHTHPSLPLGNGTISHWRGQYWFEIPTIY